ncbi:Mss4-like protein [Mycena alexandri]|uniref:Mss4-like protein n=1 Tax=Mycena alexandri TaxID=1745969 RepID=A0AAD6WZT0_9AGAR|nr:Mss4-like protein [Mycena alexandri]
MTTTAAAESTTYEGNCHCGAIKFSVVLPPLYPTGLGTGTPLYECACSICTKKGYLFVTPRKSALTLTKGAGTDGLGGGVLKEYVFGTGKWGHRFCGTCGTPFGIVNISTDAESDAVVALNARMLRGVDLWGLEVQEAPWSQAAQTAMGPYVPPVFPGPKELQATPLEEGEKIYTGSCHCGAVTFGLRSPWALEDKGPADLENNQVEECDCSTCIRFAGIYTYPRPLSRVPMHVSLSSPDALATYFSAQGNGFGGTQFCRLCGCQLFQQLVGPPAERVATLPAHVQAKIAEKIDMRPVHLRALDVALGLTEQDKAEWGRVRGNANRARGSERGKAYVVPE